MSDASATTLRDLNRLLNAALIALLVLTPIVGKFGYDRWVKIEDARRGQ